MLRPVTISLVGFPTYPPDEPDRLAKTIRRMELFGRRIPVVPDHNSRVFPFDFPCLTVVEDIATLVRRLW